GGARRGRPGRAALRLRPRPGHPGPLECRPQQRGGDERAWAPVPRGCPAERRCRSRRQRYRARHLGGESLPRVRAVLLGQAERQRARPHDCRAYRRRARRSRRDRLGAGPRDAGDAAVPARGRVSMAQLLVVDDESSARTTLALLLRKRGHRVVEADGVATAAKRLAEEVFDLVVTDLRMPDGDGLDVLRAAKAHAPTTEVIPLTAYAEWKSAKDAIQLGALDYFEKGQEPDELFHRIDKALTGGALRRENENLRAQLRERFGLPGLIAQSPTMQTVLDLVGRVAPTDATVLIQGASGTGKAVIAMAIHHARARAARPFVAVNCGAVPETLLESELFGYVRGAFTGAAINKLGLFEEADGGTLFLDEIAEMPGVLQVKLLRALQSGEVRRLGATRSATFDVRVIAATHGDLLTLISQGSFREDLFYRLNVIQLVLPPLRARRADI